MSFFIGPMEVGLERPEVSAPAASAGISASSHAGDGLCSAAPSTSGGESLSAPEPELHDEDGDDHDHQDDHDHGDELGHDHDDGLENDYPQEPADLLKIDSEFYAPGSSRFDPVYFPAENGGGGAGAAGFGSFELADTFFLHSKPDATKTIYLDFDGFTAVGTSWNNAYNNGNDITSPAYDPSNDGAAFNDSELLRIQDAWLRMAEDYAPFDVNVTTEEPPEEDLVNTGGGDERYGIRVVVTVDDFASCGCGGFAYINSFDWDYQSSGATDTPTYVFTTGSLAVAAAGSHEVGHTVGLSHDGAGGAAYYNGHGSGENGWIPIMGSGYYQNVSTFDDGEYFNTNNGGANANYGDGKSDLDVIRAYDSGSGVANRFDFRNDEAGDDLPTAAEVEYLGINASDNTKEDIGFFGIITERDDVDYVSFQTGAGTISIDVLSYVGRAHISDGAGGFEEVIVDSDYRASMGSNVQTSNLDVSATLYDSSGSVIATSDPAGLNASFTNITVEAGEYFVAIDGTSFGNPFASSPTGYTDYASIGQYMVSGTIVPIGGPLASASAADIVQRNEDDHIISVTYTDRDGVDVSTLDNNDIRVTGPNGYDVAATFLSVDDNSNGTPRIAMYSIPAPNGEWDADSSGEYIVTVQPDEVSDTAGFWSEVGDAGSFNVDIVPSIGPDGFSYIADAVAFDFVDISSTGTLILENVDDNFEELSPEGFNFDFYGVEYDSVFVSSNGLLTFGGGYSFYINSDLTDQPSFPSIAAFWDDLAAPEGGGVFWQLNGSGDEQELVLQWETRYYGATGDVTVQAVLDEAEKSITVHYADLEGGHAQSDGGDSATVGIKDAGTQGDNRLIVTFNQADNGYAETGRSVKFTVSNVAPEDIQLDDSSVNEFAAAGTSVGTLTTVDGNADDTHVYSLVPGAGDDDNALFTVAGDQLLTNAVFDAKVKDTYSVRVMSEDPFGSTVEKQLTISVHDTVQVDSIIVDDTPQRSRVDEIRVVFDGDTDIEADAFTVIQRGGGGTVDTDFTTETDGQGRTIAVITFAGPLTRANGVLVDGNYELLIDASKVSRGGVVMDGDADGIDGGDVTFGDEETDNFFALYGDSDGNRTVNFDDFFAFRDAFGATGEDEPFDFNGDDVINFDDFFAFRDQFGETLDFS